MGWPGRLKRHLALIALLVMVGAGVALHLRGVLRIELGGKEEGDRAKGAKPEQDEERGRPAPKSRIAGNKILVDDGAVEASSLRAEPAAVSSVASLLRLNGDVQLAQDRMALVGSRIPGAVGELLRAPGDEVAAGEPLLTLESVEVGAARADHVSAVASKAVLEQTYGRAKELFEKGLKPQSELWAAEAELTRARLLVGAAEAKLRALGLEPGDFAETEGRGSAGVTSRFALRSPIRGWILERHATIGANVDSKDQLFLVADLTEVWVQAAVYERDLPSVRTGMAAVVTVQALPGSRWRGEVTYLGQIVDDRTRTVPIRIVVKNEPVAGSGDRFPLRPGSFVTVELEVARKTGVLVVPLAAVQTDQGEPLVFVQAPRTRRERRADAPFEFERRAVRLGARDAEFVEVLSGVKEGDLVVVENAFLLKSEFEKSAMGDQD